MDLVGTGRILVDIYKILYELSLSVKYLNLLAVRKYVDCSYTISYQHTKMLYN